MRFNCKVADPRSLQSYLSASFFTPRPPSPRVSLAGAAPSHASGSPSGAPVTRAPLSMLRDDTSNSLSGVRAGTSRAASKPAKGVVSAPGKGRGGGSAAPAAQKGAPPGEPPDVLVDATGARCQLFETLGLTQLSTRFARATCIVVHLANHKTVEEMRLQESTWSQQYHQQTFAQLARSGCVLQNLVYYRSNGNFADCATHYFVMTSEMEALVAAGAVRSLSVSEPTARENVDLAKLEAYARQAISAFVPSLTQQPLVPEQLQIFDFSERKSSNRAALLVPGATLGGSPASRVLVTRVGDALQEPFWPEGLGINRGFFHVLDCADMVQGYTVLRRYGARVPDAEYQKLLDRREGLFAYTKRVSGANRLTELKAPTDAADKKRFAYAIDPHTRYAHLPADLPPPPQPAVLEQEADKRFFRI